MAQKTIPELNETTDFDENSLVPVDSGIQTFKIKGDNLARGLAILANPEPVAAKTANYSILQSDAFQVLRIDSSIGAFDLNLPDPAAFRKLTFKIKDVGGELSSNEVTLKQNSTEEIEGLSSDYKLQSDYGSWQVYCDGVNWFFI